MAKSLYKYIGEAWHRPAKSVTGELRWERMVQWRSEPVFHRVDRPTRLDRARALGYRAKPGFVIVRTRVRRGGLRKRAIRKGRKPRSKGILSITMAKSIRRIAEERTQKHYPNMEVLNSYWVGQDGRHKFYEVILVDPCHPAIAADPKLNWICKPQHRSRVYRGLTSAGRKGRGLRYKGKGAEHVRPSIRAGEGRGK
ncbi:MAG: 50S ribosomal protein L15e [Thermoplasmatota archaeon]